MNDLHNWQRHSQEFYFYVGRCILKYQGVEDFLKFVFASALRKDTTEIEKLYSSADNSLGRKYEFIEIALAPRGSEDEVISWVDLRAKIQRAADQRNTIAHSQPVIYGGGVALDLGANPPTATKLGPQQWQARKKTKTGNVTIVTLNDLKLFMSELEQLESELQKFTQLLRENNLAGKV